MDTLNYNQITQHQHVHVNIKCSFFMVIIKNIIEYQWYQWEIQSYHIFLFNTISSMVSLYIWCDGFFLRPTTQWGGDVVWFWLFLLFSLLFLFEYVWVVRFYACIQVVFVVI